jgi:hypothetical protein
MTRKLFVGGDPYGSVFLFTSRSVYHEADNNYPTLVKYWNVLRVNCTVEDACAKSEHYLAIYPHLLPKFDKLEVSCLCTNELVEERSLGEFD